MVTGNGRVVAALAVVALVVGALANYAELVMLGIALGLSLVLAALWLRRQPHLDVTREVRPGRVTEGESSRATLVVRNVGRHRTSPMLAREQFAGRDLEVDIPALRPDAETTISYEVPTERRGRFPIGPLTISYSDAFRLLQVVAAKGARSTLIVHPRVHRASALPTGSVRELDGGSLKSAERGGIAFHSLREYVPGDDLRLIHWASTAKTGSLLVRHNIVTHQPRLLVVLDTDASSYDDRDHFDDAVRVAASLVVAGVERSYPTEFATTGGMHEAADGQREGRTALLDLLAGVEMSDDDAGLRALVSLADRVGAVALGVVTGHPEREQARVVARVRRRFETVTMVQLRADDVRPPLHVAGVLTLGCVDAAHFEHVWNQRVRT